MVTTIANALVSRGHRVSLATMCRSSSDVYGLDSAVTREDIDVRLSIKCLPVVNGLVSTVEKAIRLRKLLRKSKATVAVALIHQTNLITILAGIGLECRVVISERSDPSREPLERGWEQLRRWFYRYADVVTANSRGVVSAMEGYVPLRKLEFLPNPVDAPEFERNVDPHSKHCLCVGRLHPSKGQDVLIRAFRKVCETDQKAVLHMVGEGPEMSKLQRLADELSIGSKVIWHGRLQDKADIYCLGSIFVLPSRREGMANSLLEAMAAGMAVVVTDSSPGPLELVRDGVNGLVVATGDEAALSAAMHKLLEKSDLRIQFGEAARVTARQYDTEKVLPHWEQVLGI